MAFFTVAKISVIDLIFSTRKIYFYKIALSTDKLKKADTGMWNSYVSIRTIPEFRTLFVPLIIYSLDYTMSCTRKTSINNVEEIDVLFGRCPVLCQTYNCEAERLGVYSHYLAHSITRSLF